MKQTGMMLDIARTSFNKADIIGYIDFVKENGGHYLQLHFCDSNRYAIESKVLGNPPKQDQNDYILSLEEVKEISEYSKGKGIELVPELELPSHCNKLLDLLFNHNWDYWNSVRTHEGGYQLHLGSPETYQLTKELITELMGAFTNTKTIHLGGDEFEYGSENTHLNVCNFFNNLSLWILETYQCRTRVWNDFITKDILSKEMLNTRIDVVYWSITGEATKGSDVEKERLRTKATLQEIVDYGNHAWNSQAWFCYSVPNDTRDFTSWNSVYAGRDLIERWDLSVSGYQNTFTRLKNTDKVLGSMFCVWTENLVKSHDSPLKESNLTLYLEYHAKAMFDIVNSYNTENVIAANNLLEAPYEFHLFKYNSAQNPMTIEVVGNFELNSLIVDKKEVKLVPFNENPINFTAKGFSVSALNKGVLTSSNNNNLKLLFDPNKINFIEYDKFYEENTSMPLIRFEKIVHSLPTGSEIKPNTVYYLREGQGFSTFVSDATGSIIHKLNIPEGSGGVVVSANTKLYRIPDKYFPDYQNTSDVVTEKYGILNDSKLSVLIQCVKGTTSDGLSKGQHKILTFISLADNTIPDDWELLKNSDITQQNPVTTKRSWIEYITDYNYQANVVLENGAMMYKNEALEPKVVYRLIQDGIDYILDKPSLGGAVIYAKRSIG